jgi:hypothetical protein
VNSDGLATVDTIKAYIALVVSSCKIRKVDPNLSKVWDCLRYVFSCKLTTAAGRSFNLSSMQSSSNNMLHKGKWSNYYCSGEEEGGENFVIRMFRLLLCPTN